VVTDPLGRASRTVVDGIGRVAATRDPTGATTRTTYDAVNQVRSITDPLGRTTGFDYDANGNLTKVTDPRINTTVYAYNELNQVATVTDPLNRVTSYGYDTNGNVTTTTSPRNKITSHTYDALNRLTTTKYGVSGATSESQTSYSYDAGNRATSINDSAGGTATLTINGLDQLTRSVVPQGQIDYTYNAAQRTGMTVAGQPQVTYGYNPAGQMTSVARAADTVAITYDAIGRRASITLPNGVNQAYGYDGANQLDSITYTRGSTTLGNLAYAYDPAGRTSRISGTYARADVPAAYGPATYDNANQLTTLATTPRTYDADGNLTSDGTTSYGWNARGQLASATRPGESSAYGYDGMGRRTSRTVGAATTGYLYDGLNAVQELSGTTPTATMLTGTIDQVFSRTSGGTSRSLLTDALGSTVGVADAAGAVVGEYSYQPFGATTLTGTDGGNATRFTGREDDGNGAYFSRARYYSSSDQRFLSQDPIGFASGTTNHYAYVSNQPTGLVDPLGTSCETVFYHGGVVPSLLDILNNGLNAGGAVENYTDGPGGFFLATHVWDAEHFAFRLGRGGVIKVTIDAASLVQLQEAGSVMSPLIKGDRTPHFKGDQLQIPVSAFDLFNELTNRGGIVVSPQ
jgi:RHS repeat-associated protein